MPEDIALIDGRISQMNVAESTAASFGELRPGLLSQILPKRYYFANESKDDFTVGVVER